MIIFLTNLQFQRHTVIVPLFLVISRTAIRNDFHESRFGWPVKAIQVHN